MHRIFVLPACRWSILVLLCSVPFWGYGQGQVSYPQNGPPIMYGQNDPGSYCPGDMYVYFLSREYEGSYAGPLNDPSVSTEQVAWSIPNGNGRFVLLNNSECVVEWFRGSAQPYILRARGRYHHDSFDLSRTLTMLAFPAQPGTLSVSPTVSSEAALCTETLYTYSVPAQAGMEYQWVIRTGTGAFVGPTNGASVQVRWTAEAAQGRVEVRAFNGNCSSDWQTRSHPVVAAPQVSAGATLTVDGSPVHFCAGQTYTFRLNGSVAHATSFKWLLPDGTQRTTSEPVTQITFGQQSGTVQLIGSNACREATPVSRNVSVLSAAAIGSVSLSGPALICPDRAYTYQGSVAGALYQWNATNIQGITVNGQGTATAQLSFSESVFGINGTDPVTVEVQITNPCSPDPAVTRTFTVQARKARAVRQATFTAAELVPLASKTLFLNTCEQTDPVLCGLQQLRKATLRAALSTGDIHLLPEGTELASSVILQLQGRNAAGQVVTSLGLPASVTLELKKQQPEQWFSFSLTTPAQLEAYTQITSLVATVQSATVASQLGNHIQLRVWYEEEYIHVPTASVPTGLTCMAAGGYSYQFSWQAPNCPFVAGYEFQLVRLYESGTPIDPTGPQAGVLPTAGQINWTQALTLETERTTTALELTVAEGTGTYAWRVRALGNQTGGVANPANWGEWSAPVTFAFVQPDEGGQQPGTNWIYSRTFTEGGRVAEQMSFADGLGQPAQTQSKIQSQNQVVISESRQDYIGRAAIQTLPVPMVNKTRLGYVPDFLTDSLRNRYTKINYDADSTYKRPHPMRLDAVHNGDYYSGTPVKNASGDTLNPYVPSAQGYPYTRTRYATDGTSRVVEQSGVGRDHRLGGAHSVKTYYSSVAEPELLRLFGKEAPLASNVHKTITVDPNGTSSVSYMTKDGKVLATALINTRDTINPKPYALDTLASAREATKVITERLTDRSPFGSIGTYTSKSVVFVIPTDLNVYYGLTPDAIADACRQASCKTCDYQVEIRIRNAEEPDLLLARLTRKLPLGSCGENATLQKIDTVLKGLVGTYLIEKRLTTYTTMPPTPQQRADSLSPQQYIEHELDVLAAYYSEQNLLQGAFWNRLRGYLADSTANATALYHWLDSLHTVNPNVYRRRTDADGKRYYQLEVPLAQGTSGPDCESLWLEIPYIETFCPSYTCPQTVGSTDTLSSFESYFQNRLAKAFPAQVAPTLAQVLNSIDPIGWEDTDWDYMMHNLVSTGYGCQKLWNAWQSAVDFYIQTLRTPSLGVVPDVSLSGVGSFASGDELNQPPVWLSLFFETVGAKKHIGVGRRETGNFTLSRTLRRQYYQVFYLPLLFSNGNPTLTEKVGRCASQLGISLPAPVTLYEQEQVRTFAAGLGDSLAACIRYMKTQPLTDAQRLRLDTLTVQKIDSVCIRREGEFRTQLIDAIHAKGQYVQGDLYTLVADPFTGKLLASGAERDSSQYAYSQCQLQKMAAACVAYCQQGISVDLLRVANRSEQNPDPDQVALIRAARLSIEQILLHEATVQVSAQPFGPLHCGADYVRLGDVLPEPDSVVLPAPLPLRRVLSMDGLRPYLQVAHSDSLVFSDRFSASLWIMRKGQTQTELLHKYSSSNADGWGIEYRADGVLKVWIPGATPSGYIDVPCVLENYRWTHIVVTNSAPSGQAARLVVYKNGQPIVNPATGQPWFASRSILDNPSYGLQSSQGVLYMDPLSGYIDEISLYRQVLTPVQVDSLYRTRGKAAVLYGAQIGLHPVAIWDFDQPSGTVVADQSGLGHTMQLIGYSEIETAPASAATPQSRWQTIHSQPPPRDKLVGYWHFDQDGTGSVVSDASCHGHDAILSAGAQRSSVGSLSGSSLLGIGGNASFAQVPSLTWQPSVFSVSFWLKPSDLDHWQMVSGGPQWGSFVFALAPGGAIYVGTDQAHAIQTPEGVVESGDWQLFSFTFQNGTGSLYKNGEWVASRTDMALPTAWEGLWMGGDFSGNPLYLVGMLDEVQLYGSVLTQAQMYYLLENQKVLLSGRCAQVAACRQTPAFCFKWRGSIAQDSISLGDNMTAYVDQVRAVPCEKLRTQAVAQRLRSQLDSIRAAHVGAYRAQYQAVCAGQEQLRDTLRLGYALGYHHFTLYYYDRAGNLIRTVPPAGVGLLDGLPVAAQADTLPTHRLVTEYSYNSLGQLVEQTTPDGGKTVFYYNDKSQLRFSVNGRQQQSGHFSYTRYDHLGRVTEVGQAQGSVDQSKLQEMSYPSLNLSQVTRTVYSTPSGIAYSPNGQTSLPQRHLQNRVSYSYLDADGSDGTTDDRQSSYYSYDAHGNVEWLVQEIPGLGKKHIRYEYDLISGKVLKVLYQEQTQDQFYHRYSYDEDNRLTVVQTSKDGVIWEKDATYSYYRHGPLQRIELGEDRVQGVDYTYTIHGWLKAINHPDLTAAHDPGQDGRGIVPADAFGMALSYYEGDYVRSPQNGGLHQDNIQKPLTGKSLYNGNIASWTSQIQKATGQSGYPSEGLTAEQFGYDELNRIKSSTFSVYNGTSWEQKQDYATSYSYDANGNILKLHRNAYQPQGSALQLEMDRLTYRYYEGTNRLRRVEDAVTTADWTEDIENQTGDQEGNNYVYDVLGQLIKDNQERLEIEWNVYHRVQKLTRRTAQNQISQVVEYTYDFSGNRISKTVRDKTTTPEKITTTYYVRDAQGQVLAVYDNEGTSLQQKEVFIYGMQQLGVYYPLSEQQAAARITTRYLGYKEYELTDHLGNVRAVVGDYREGGTNEPIRVALRNYFNYYAFGQDQPGRTYVGSQRYRYGYTGMEREGAWGAEGIYTTLHRMYDARTARWYSVDPLVNSLPAYSPYSAFNNRPTIATDKEGDCAGCLTGAAIEMLLDVVFQVGENMMFNDMDFVTALDNISWTSVMWSGASGFASGAVTGGIDKLVKVIANPTKRRILQKVLEEGSEYLLGKIEELGKEYVDENFRLDPSFYTTINKYTGLKLGGAAVATGAVAGAALSKQETGDIGEAAVKADLEKRYPKAHGYEIVEQVEGKFADGSKTRFDFVVVRTETTGVKQVIGVVESKVNNGKLTPGQVDFYTNGKTVTLTGKNAVDKKIDGKSFDKSKVMSAKYKVKVNKNTGDIEPQRIKGQKKRVNIRRTLF